jgi:hypothetical protein
MGDYTDYLVLLLGCGRKTHTVSCHCKLKEKNDDRMNIKIGQEYRRKDRKKLGYEVVHVQKNGGHREGKRKGQQMLIGWTRDGKEILEKEGI